MGNSNGRRIVIMGAAGRDFHNFNRVYRDNPDYRVVAFTATQIPEISGRCYPAVLAGALYPEGIPILEQSQLEQIIAGQGIDQVVFAYSDVSQAEVMHIASQVLAAGCDFVMLGPERTMLQSKVPVIAVSAVRTGCGKSPTSRWLSRYLKSQGVRVGVMRHPMPYGDLASQTAQRFSRHEDLLAADCTIEEREEYEPHIDAGGLVFAGVDYGEVLAMAEQEVDLIIWDGGNNDFPFIRPDLHIVLVDPLRPGHETSHYPGEVVLRMADVVVISKVNAAAAADVQAVTERVRQVIPGVPIIQAASEVTLDNEAAVRGRQVLVVEDGPSITHGGMAYGAGYVASLAAGVAEIVDPRTAAVPSIRAVFEKYPHIGRVLPALGYSLDQLQALQASINAMDADVVVAATPCDLGALIDIDKPLIRARYEYKELEVPGLEGLVAEFLSQVKQVA
ncbi:MAG: cyclic 2,3-diphosphoglycerate synthase [Candidatus Sedimenticola sp. (ex Thyasira tokunagai)]